MPNRVNMLIDIHCHLLPGLDDGAATLDDALAMATMAVADGIQTIIATPHQLGSHASLSGDTIRAAVRRFQRVLDQRRVPLRVLPGADVRIEPDLPRKIRTGEVVTLADRRRHVLLELPHDVYVSLDRLLADLRSAGLVGILSHPERNRGILRQPSVLRPLVENGCLLQVTAGSLTGLFGLQIKHFSESLIEQGLVHFIASDAHDTVRRPLSLRPAFQRTKELAGIEAAERLFHRNPAAVAAGQNVSSHCQKSATLPWAGWLRRTFSSEPASPSPI